MATQTGPLKAGDICPTYPKCTGRVTAAHATKRPGLFHCGSCSGTWNAQRQPWTAPGARGQSASTSTTTKPQSEVYDAKGNQLTPTGDGNYADADGKIATVYYDKTGKQIGAVPA